MSKLLWVSFLVIQVAFAGFDRTDLGARSIALGMSSVQHLFTPWAIVGNPAGLADIESFEASFFYSPQPFGLTELSLTAVAAVLPLQKFEIGIEGRKFGFDLYHEVSGTIGLAKRFGNLEVGTSLTFYTVGIPNYGSAGTVGVDVGLLARFSDLIRWGIIIRNINMPTIGAAQEKLPEVFTTGISLAPAKQCIFSGDLQKEISFDPTLRGGMEYWIIDALALRAGIIGEPAEYTGGFGLKYSAFVFDYAFTSHGDLGLSHFITLTIQTGAI